VNGNGSGQHIILTCKFNALSSHDLKIIENIRNFPEINFGENDF